MAAVARPAASTLIDRVDSRDRPIGVVPRGAALAERANFRTAHVFVFNRAGELLLQRLAHRRERHPGRWGSSVAAYLFAGEPYEDAARRRMRDELGLSGQPQFVGKTKMRDEGSTKFVALFRFISDHAQATAPDHIEQVRFWRFEEVQREVGEDPDAFTPTFRHLLRFYVQRAAR